jgi:hypothetical protein
VALGTVAACSAECAEQRSATPIFVRREEDLRFVVGGAGDKRWLGRCTWVK